MTCTYCRYMNAEDEHRCRRCGRPLADAYAMATSGSLATVPQPSPSDASQEFQPAAPPGPLRQSLLFPEKPNGKIIPFAPDLEPLAPPKRKAAPRAARPRAPKPVNEAQASLDFLPPAAPTTRKLSTTVEAVICCDAPVAAPMHRAVAAAFDASMVLIAYGIFLTTFHLLGGAFAFDKLTLLVFGAAAALIGGFYGFVSVWSGQPTPGMRFAHLSLINFDGFPPDRSSRWARYLAACLSFGACGLGILWALVDEESLAWHDHISKTFPTFRGPETNFVRHR